MFRIKQKQLGYSMKEYNAMALICLLMGCSKMEPMPTTLDYSVGKYRCEGYSINKNYVNLQVVKTDTIQFINIERAIEKLNDSLLRMNLFSDSFRTNYGHTDFTVINDSFFEIPNLYTKVKGRLYRDSFSYSEKYQTHEYYHYDCWSCKKIAL